MKQINRNITRLTGAAAVTALLLTALPTAGATAFDGPGKNKNRGVNVTAHYEFSPVRGVVDRRYYKRPIKVFVRFEGMKDRHINRDMRRFTRDVTRQMQYRSDRRLVFVGNKRAADRVIRIPKREWKRDYRAYAGGGYYPDRRYVRYDRRNDPAYRVAYIALDIAHLIRDERRYRDRIERREDRREDRRDNRRDRRGN